MMALENRTMPAALFDTATTRNVEILRALIAAGKAPRIAMVGKSMLPLLHQPMILELGAITDRADLGDILVFAKEGRLWAHRVVGYRDGTHFTAGDHNPWRLDSVAPDQVVGRVCAVYSDDSPDAKRIDDARFHRFGMLMARTRVPRKWWHKSVYQLLRIPRGLNAWSRPRGFVALLHATRATLQESKAELESALDLVDEETLLAAVTRHSCAGILFQGMSSLGVEPPSKQFLIKGLQLSTRATALKVLLLRNQISALIKTLRDAQVEFATLKGAARIYSGDADAYIHRSSDIDVLTRREDLDRAVNALLAAGYMQRGDAATAASYKARHHHAAPLIPKAGGAAVELHVALVRPGKLSQILDWEYLSPHLTTFNGPAGEVRCLNDVGTALHLATHAVGIKRLRDIVLLAKVMRRIDQRGLMRLKQFAAQEKTEPVRLEAVFALAAWLAGIAWEQSVKVRDYLRWVAAREDLPSFIRQRCQLVEACYATESNRARMREVLFDFASFLNPQATWRHFIFAPFRTFGRLVVGSVAFAYIKAMPRADFP